MKWIELFRESPDGKGSAFAPTWVRALNAVGAAALLALILAFAFHKLEYQWNWESILEYRHSFVQGWWMTVVLSAVSLVLSFVLGMIVALSRRSRWLVPRYLARVYVETIRGTPLLVQILIFFYVIADAFGLDNRYVAGVLILSIFSGAYISEIIRAGIESVGASQLESAKAVGFTDWQTYRFVVFPQALSRSLPPLAGQFVSLVKDSSLLSIIGISELTLRAQEVNASTYSALESYLPLAAGYWILTLPLSLWTRSLEARHRFET